MEYPIFQSRSGEREKSNYSTRLEAALSEENGSAKGLPVDENSYSSWQPFLWELEERQSPMAKVQLAGPMTCQMALKVTDGKLDEEPILTSQLFQTVLAKAMGMIRPLLERGIRPVFFFDEPALFALDRTHPRHIVALQELRLAISTLKKRGALVGLHCCANTDWKAIFSLGLDAVSFDVFQSIDLILDASSEVKHFLLEGGRLFFGVISTQGDSLNEADPTEATKRLSEIREFFQKLGLNSKRIEKELDRSVLTPACGLATLKVEEAESIWSRLQVFRSPS